MSRAFRNVKTRPYGSKRTYAKCSTGLRHAGGTIKVRVFVKNRKRDRSLAKLRIQEDD